MTLISGVLAKNDFDYGALTKADFEIIRRYDHFNREIFQFVSESYKPKSSEFLVRIPSTEGLTSSGSQSKLEYNIKGKWVTDKMIALQSTLPKSIPAEQLTALEEWVDHYDKEALSKLKPLAGEWKSAAKLWLDKHAKTENGKYLLFHGDRERRHEKFVRSIAFKYITSVTTKNSIARNFGAPIGNHGKPVGKGHIHSILIPLNAVFFIPSLWKKYSRILRQYSKENEVLVKPGSYETIN